MTDLEHASAIKSAVEALNAAVDNAAKDGLDVEITKYTVTQIGVPDSVTLGATVTRKICV